MKVELHNYGISLRVNLIKNITSALECFQHSSTLRNIYNITKTKGQVAFLVRAFHVRDFICVLLLISY